MDSRILTISIILMMSLMIAGCTEDKDEGDEEENEKIGYPTDTRYSKIPQEAVKMGPDGDPHPPVRSIPQVPRILHSFCLTGTPSTSSSRRM